RLLVWHRKSGKSADRLRRERQAAALSVREIRCATARFTIPVTLHIQSVHILLGGWGRGHPWPARHLSRIRRSRLVGRPAPRSRAATGTEEAGGGAGVRSR